MPQESANYWSSSENSRNNAWNVNSNTGNTNNNNKYNSMYVRAAVAHDGFNERIRAVCEAFEDCKKGKMSSPHTLEYLERARQDLPKLAYEIYSKTYKPTTSICFLVRYPKLREVFAADFRDRIVHHWIILRLEPLFEKRFVEMGNTSFNCRKGFGTLAAVKAAERGMAEMSNNYTKKAWVFKGDLVSFFMSINKDKLWYLLERLINRKYLGNDKDVLLYLVKTVIYHHPEEDCIINGCADEWNRLDRNKSLFSIDKGLGGPIGNHTTQQFANYYLAMLLDTWLMFLMRRIRYRYVRFVDDFLIISPDKRKILDTVGKLEKICSSYGIIIHRDKRYMQPASHGVLFVGGFIKPRRTYVSNRVLGRFRERMSGFKAMLDGGNVNIYDLARMEQVVNSYLGLCVHHRTYRLRRSCILGVGCSFWKYFYVKGHYESIHVKKKHRAF